MLYTNGGHALPGVLHFNSMRYSYYLYFLTPSYLHIKFIDNRMKFLWGILTAK